MVAAGPGRGEHGGFCGMWGKACDSISTKATGLRYGVGSASAAKRLCEQRNRGCLGKTAFVSSAVTAETRLQSSLELACWFYESPNSDRWLSSDLDMMSKILWLSDALEKVDFHLKAALHRQQKNSLG